MPNIASSHTFFGVPRHHSRHHLRHHPPGLSPGARVFKGFYLWNMPQSDISKAAKTWRLTRTLVRNGAIVKELKETKKGIERQTHFPAQKHTEVAHVRPHAQNAADVYPLPTADKLTGATEYTKHSFWLNADYLKMVIAGLQSVPNR